MNQVATSCSMQLRLTPLPLPRCLGDRGAATAALPLVPVPPTGQPWCGTWRRTVAPPPTALPDGCASWVSTLQHHHRRRRPRGTLIYAVEERADQKPICKKRRRRPQDRAQGELSVAAISNGALPIGFHLQTLLHDAFSRPVAPSTRQRRIYVWVALSLSFVIARLSAVFNV
jgi:hypothetical protein